MTFRGSAFMIMWHDVAVGSERNYDAWHTTEHMPERLALPGFLRGRRGINWELDRHCILTIYETDDLEALRSDAYLERLNKPTEWTSRMAPAFRNFLRVACETCSTIGNGAGGAIGTYRIDLVDGADPQSWVKQIAKNMADFMDLPGISSVHLALPRPAYSDIRTTETQIRPKMAEKDFDVLLLVEAIGLKELNDANGDVVEHLAREGCHEVTSQLYSLAFLLGPNGDS